MAQGDIVDRAQIGADDGAISIPKTSGGGEVAAKLVVMATPAGTAVTPLGAVTEDAAAAANPSGPQLMARRKDTLATNEVSADGDVIALNATNKGQLHTFAEGPMTSAEFLANLRSTAAFTSVNSAGASTTILAANANRKGAIIVNTDANVLYLDLTGGTASTTRYAAALASGEEYPIPFGLTGLITGIWAADGAGAALVTEFS